MKETPIADGLNKRYMTQLDAHPMFNPLTPDSFQVYEFAKMSIQLQYTIDQALELSGKLAEMDTEDGKRNKDVDRTALLSLFDDPEPIMLHESSFENGKTNLLMSHPNVALMVAAFAKYFDDSGAPNFVEVTLTDKPTNRTFIITTQLKSGKTPWQKMTEAEQKIKRLEHEIMTGGEYWVKQAIILGVPYEKMGHEDMIEEVKFRLKLEVDKMIAEQEKEDSK